MKIGEPKKYDSIPLNGNATVLSKSLSALQIGQMLPVQFDNRKERANIYASASQYGKAHGMKFITRTNGDTLEIYRVAKEA